MSSKSESIEEIVFTMSYNPSLRSSNLRSLQAASFVGEEVNPDPSLAVVEGANVVVPTVSDGSLVSVAAVGAFMGLAEGWPPTGRLAGLSAPDGATVGGDVMPGDAGANTGDDVVMGALVGACVGATEVLSDIAVVGTNVSRTSLFVGRGVAICETGELVGVGVDCDVGFAVVGGVVAVWETGALVGVGVGFDVGFAVTGRVVAVGAMGALDSAGVGSNVGVRLDVGVAVVGRLVATCTMGELVSVGLEVGLSIALGVGFTVGC